MTFGNSVRDDQQLRDIQELIAKLKDVNRQLALPLRGTPAAVVPMTVVEAPVLEAGPAETASA